MSNVPAFANAGDQTDTIDVRLSYKIVELFSEGLYASPNKAVEELVANAFDAGGAERSGHCFFESTRPRCNDRRYRRWRRHGR